MDILSSGQPLLPDVFRMATDRAFNQIILTDPEGIIVYANTGLTRITGFTPADVIGHTSRMWGGVMSRKFYADFWDRIKVQKKPFRGQVQNKRKDGKIYDAVITVSPILDANTLLVGFIGVEEELSDIEELKMKILTQPRVSESDIHRD